MLPSPKSQKNEFPFCELFTKSTELGMHIKGSGTETVDSIVLKSNLKAAKLQRLAVPLTLEYAPGVVTKPLLLPLHAAHDWDSYVLLP